VNHVSRISDWLRHAALPLWAETGIDRAAGGFVERLDWAGRPIFDIPKRIRVQARQIYVYASAHRLGLYPGALAAANKGFDFLIAHACPDGPEAGFVHALTRDGGVHSARRDTYDHAFLLFAFSALYRATGEDRVRAAIDATAHALATRLRHSGGDGYSDDDTLDEGRSQNPHMHLLEAFLEAYEATGSATFLRNAEEIFILFRDRMFDPAYGVLREHYAADWSPAAGARGAIVEPGHHEEWAWLLHRHAQLSGTPVAVEAEELHSFARTHGRPRGSILLCDELDPKGAILKASQRSWPQTEALKAELAFAEAAGMNSPMADAIVSALFDHYLAHPVPGAWIDWIDADGAPMVDYVPASTFYHLFLAFSEYLRVAGMHE
jgi:mannose-6-phosphate isomerase